MLLVLIFSSDLDTIGIISPDLETLGEVAKHFYDSSAPDKADLIDKKPPPVFLYPNHLFPVADDSAQQIYDRVAEALETVLGVQRTAVDFNELWQSNQTTEEPFEDYFAPVSDTLINLINEFGIIYLTSNKHVVTLPICCLGTIS